MTMIDTTKWERKEYELTCISPIHIGNGELYKSYEYYYDRYNHMVYFLDPVKWADFLAAKGLMDAYAQDVEKEKGRLYLKRWLDAKVERGQALQAVKKMTLSSSSVCLSSEKRESVNDIARQQRDVYGYPIIPGSSLKGVIHSAIRWHLICRNPEKYRDLWPEIQSAVGQGNRREVQVRVRNLTVQLEKRTVNVLHLTDQSGKDALNSVMRGIRISDAHLTVKKRDTVLIQKLDASFKKKKGYGRAAVEPEGHTLSVFRECIPSRSRYRFTITLEREIVQKIGLSSLKELWQWVREYTQAGIHMQETVFGEDFSAEFKEAKTADLLLGGGTGFLSKTVLYALAPSQEEGQQTLAKYLDKAFHKGWRPAHYHQRDDQGLTPRTVKLARFGQERWLLGLASVKEVK